ncbi:MAG: PilW family protein [Gammaproteobacteria bacterium]|nr:PilW family protein [Gammaproteobacteria bacterium]NND47704.1 prepilin-type N-terminal cleavage/methylation domain-containing protein [Woeseiaceae bacterium]NNL44842.1 prepilin-type N-terminal cleavage/methylation domain-containing protein [Woeseiaceae bacterium]
MNEVHVKSARHQTGLTLTELMVALAIGSFLMIGAIQIYNQSREAFVVNESIARVQETAQFAMDTIEADLRMASNWGRNSRGLAVEGRSLTDDADPNDLDPPADCGARWVLDLGKPIDGNNNSFDLACGPTVEAGAAQPNSDVITVRRASVDPVAPDIGRFQIQSTRIQGELFKDGVIPNSFEPPANAALAATPTDPSATHNLLINSYYVAQESQLIPGVPTLRRKTLTIDTGVSVIDDQEVAPGVENIQLQLGIDVDQDNTVDRYVNPGDGIYDPNSADYVPGARVMTARVWMIVRSVTREPGVQDTNTYKPGDLADALTLDDGYRRMQVSKTVLLRNART